MKSTLKYILVCGSILGFIGFGTACATKKNNNSGTTQTQQEADTLSHIVVSFYSIGTGINSGAHNSFKALLSEYQDQKKWQMNMTVRPWGREGEIDYCIDFHNLNQDKKGEFLKKIQTLLDGQNYTRILYNSPCREADPRFNQK